MQQTKLDHWLRRKFVHEMRVYCNTLPEKIDEGLRVEEAPEGKPASHRFRVLLPDEQRLEELVDQLRLHGITYTAIIDDKQGLVANWIARPGRSVTFELIWLLIGVGGIGALLWTLSRVQFLSRMESLFF